MKKRRPSANLGTAIRGLRAGRKLRLADLAKKTGLSISYLSQIERDRIAPSISSLTLIADGLGTGVAQLLGGMKARPRVSVVRKGQRKGLVRPGSPAINEMLTPDLRGAFEMFWSMLDPGRKSPLLEHDGEECGVVVRGTLTVWIGDEKHVLKPGDSITFRSDEPHRFENRGKVRVETVWCISPPSY